MKVRNPKTGNLEEVYVKASDTLPVGSIVEIPDDMTVPDGWEEIEDKAMYLKNVYNSGRIWHGDKVATDINVNAGNGGKVYMLCYSAHGDTGNNTSAYMGMLRCGYDQNNYSITTISEDKKASLQINFSIDANGYLEYQKSSTKGAAKLSIYELTSIGSGVKKIRKKATSIGVTAKSLNEYSNSTENVYSCDYVNKLHSYSTEEHIVGICKKEDGTEVPLYQKMISGTTPIVSENGKTVNQVYNIGDNIELSFIEFGFVHISGLGQATIPYMSDSGNFVKAVSNKSTLTIFSNNVSFGNRPFNISILYIKNTKLKESD